MMDDKELQITTDEQPSEPVAAEMENVETQSEEKVTPTSVPESAFDGYKKQDGSYDIDKLLKDFSAERDRSAGLRKKLAEPKKIKPFDVSDLSISVPEEEKGVMADLVKTFNETGISKDQTEKILAKLSEYAIDEKQREKNIEETYQAELKKLGTEKDNILNSLKSFAETMVANKVWDGNQKQVFFDSVSSAEVAKMFHNAIQNLNVIRAGEFTSHHSQSIPQEYSKQDKVDMYRRAFDLLKTNKAEAEAEIRRLDNVLGIK